MKKRILAVLLASALILSLMPAVAFADTSDGSSGGSTPPTLTYGAWEVDADTGVWTWEWDSEDNPYSGKSIIGGDSGFCTFDPGTGTLTIKASTHSVYGTGNADRPWEDFKEKITSIVADGSEVEGGITIGTMAFSGLTALKSVKLTNCTLGSYAFEQTKINEVEFNNCTLNSNYLFDSAEVGNLTLTECTISGTKVFSCDDKSSACQITNIVTNDTNLPAGTFTTLSGVETITVNGGSLGAITYSTGSYYSTALPTGTIQSVTVDGATLSEGAFSNCTVSQVTIKNVQTLPAYTFTGYSEMQTLTLENITTISGNAIYANRYVESITLNHIGTLEGSYTSSAGLKSAIYYCQALKAITMNDVGTLKTYSIYWNTALETITMEDVTTLQDYCIYYGPKLTTIYYKNIGSKPKLYNCGSVEWEEVEEIPGLDNLLTEPVVWKNGKWEKDTTSNIWTYYINDLTWKWDPTENKWTSTTATDQKSACTYDPATRTLTLLTSTPDYSAEGGQPWTSGGPFANGSTNVIKSITADDSDIAIGAYAFAGIEDLESVTLNGVTLKEYSVANTSATEIIIENVDTLPSYSIASNHELEALTVKNVGEIALGAIWYNGDQTDDSLSLTLTISDVDTLPSGAIYKNHNLTTLKLENITTLEKYFVSDGYEGEPSNLSYYGSKSLETVELKNVDNISAYAFYNCPELSSLSGLKDAKYIGGYAFYNCPNLKWNYANDQPSDTAQIGWNQFFQQSEDMIARMKAIMAGKFSLAKAQTPDAGKLTVSRGWDNSKAGTENSTEVNGNQVTKSARWTDSDRTKAQVQFQFTSAEEPGADFLFVVDSSASMSIVGNQSDTSSNTGSDGPQLPSDDDVRDTGEDLELSEDELNARFYAMQSKLLDVTDELLTAQGYDNRVAVLNFGGYYNLKEGTVESTNGFISDADTMRNYLLNDFEPYYENTDFVMALDAAYERFVKDHDTSRKLVVIFISDGIPTMEDTGTTQHQIGVNVKQDWESTYRPHIAEAAKKITDAGAEIFGVLHLYAGEPNDQVTRANSAMSAVCGLYFEADDTEAFSDAVNDAIGAGWGVYTLTDTVDPGFTLDQDSIEVTCGKTQVTADDDGNTVITWTIYGVPFTTYTMTYDVSLNQVNGAYPYGRFDTNEGDAVVTKGIGTEQEVNRVPTPRLNRYKDIPVNPVQPSKPVTPPALNLEDHVAYIIGDDNGLARPMAYITRAEVATIFFRLLTDESRAYYWSTTNPYPDVNANDWFNNAVSTLTNAGILTGMPDGTFAPYQTITRAEFATIAARFSDVAFNGECPFPDVAKTHWAYEYIGLAYELGWVLGLGDGTFGPSQNITRAEAVTLINRVLERDVEKEHMLPDMITWSDNLSGAWYYEAIQEATNSHEYVRTAKQVPGQDFNYEDWKDILKVPDWAALERAWSTANSK